MSLRSTSKSDHRLPSRSSTTAVQIHTDRRFFPRRTPSMSTSHRMKSSSLGAYPRLFRVSSSPTREAPTRRACAPNAPRPLSGWTKGLFFNPDEHGRLVYLHRPAYRRHARALGVHGERPVYDFGRVAVAVAVGGVSVLAVPATVRLLAPGTARPWASSWSRSGDISCRVGRRTVPPFQALSMRWIERIIHNQRV